MDKITNNFFHSQTNSTTELGHSPPFLDLSRKLLVNGFLIMINYIYNQLYNLQGWFVMVSDCEELVGVTHKREWGWILGLITIQISIRVYIGQNWTYFVLFKVFT